MYKLNKQGVEKMGLERVVIEKVAEELPNSDPNLLADVCLLL